METYGNPRPFCPVGNATRVWFGVHCQSTVATTKLLLLLFACQTYLLSARTRHLQNDVAKMGPRIDEDGHDHTDMF